MSSTSTTHEPEAAGEGPPASAARPLDRAAFAAAYRERVLDNRFFEEPDYYRRQRARYYHTLRFMAALPLPRHAEVLDIGGGQIALLAQKLWGDRTTVADVREGYSASLEPFGVATVTCDLTRDDLDQRDAYDLVVLGEVVEHLPMPLHLVLEKIIRWLKPGGYVLITTPNVHRPRNWLRLAVGMQVFSLFHYPPRGGSLGHPFEFNTAQLHWHLERAGFDRIDITLTQLVNHGSTWPAHLARLACAPMQLRPLWRDSIVATGCKPE